MPGRFLLTLTESDGKSREHRLAPGTYVIGREADCDIVVSSSDVSRHHARLTLNQTDLLIEDLGSSTGTRVQNLPVAAGPQRWPYPQSLDFGSVNLDVRQLDGANEPSPATMGADPDSPVPFVFGSEIAHGGMGSIIEADDRRLGRKIAVKVMRLEVGADEAQMQRFVQEAAVLGRLEHPNIVPIHDLGRDSRGQLYYTMKLVKGRTLQAILNDLRNEPFDASRHYTLDRLLTVFRKVCDAMAFAHSQGIIHRDLKPENIMVGEFGEVLVMDWGLAKCLNIECRMSNVEVPEAHATRSSFDILHSSFSGTLQGDVMGTPQYMSPEQAAGRIADMDARSDLFSLGSILYAILTLRPPVEGGTLDEVLHKVASGDITAPWELQTRTGTGHKPTGKSEALDPRLIAALPHLPGGRVPAALSSVVMKALRLDKAQRYPAVAALSADVEAYQGGFATSAERAGVSRQLLLLMKRNRGIFSTASVALLALAAFGLWFIVNLRASERRAKANEQRAVAQEEETRRTLAQAQVAVAEAAFRGGDRTAMVEALESVPGDLRDQLWGYLSQKRNASQGPFRMLDPKEVSAVTAVPGQPDCFAIAYSSGALQIVNVRTGENMLTLKSVFSGDMALGFSPDGSRVALTAKGAADIRILRTNNGSRVQVLPAPSKRIDRLVFSPNGLLLAAAEPPAGGGAKLSLIDLTSGAVRWQQDFGYSGVHFSPDGTRLFVATHGSLRKFRTFDVATGRIIDERDANTFSTAMSLDGKQLALGLQSGEVAIIDTATGAELRRARLHQGEVTHMVWTTRGHLLTLGNHGGLANTARGRRLLRLWDASTFALRGTFFGISQLPNEPGWDFQAASGYLLTRESPPQLWHIPVDAEAARIVCGSEQGRSVCFLSDTMLLARKLHDQAPYDVRDPKQPRELPTPLRDGESMSVVNWSAGLVATGKHTGRAPFSVRIFGTTSDLPLKREIPVRAQVSRLAFDASGARLLASLRNNTVQIFATDTGEELLKVPHAVNRAVFSPTGDRFIAIVPTKAGAEENVDMLKIIDGKTGEVLKKVVHRMRLNDLVASPDHRLVAVSGEEPVVRVLDAGTLDERFAFRAHDDDITALAFHPTEPILASASNDGTVKLWDYESANLRQTFLGIDGTPVMLAFSPNGRLLALESQEHVVRIFDLAALTAPVPMTGPKPVIAPDAEGWMDLLGAMNADEVKESGSGWQLENGALRSPAVDYATVTLPVDPPAGSYQLRVTVRQAEPTDRFAMLFTVGGRDTVFLIDEWPENYASGLGFNARNNATREDAIRGRQILDHENHEIALTVRVAGQKAKIEVQLDRKPIFQWTGVVTEVGRSPFWRKAPTGALSLGSNSANWVVSEVKLKRLD